jgi:hypothetical protein
MNAINFGLGDYFVHERTGAKFVCVQRTQRTTDGEVALELMIVPSRSTARADESQSALSFKDECAKVAAYMATNRQWDKS